MNNSLTKTQMNYMEIGLNTQPYNLESIVTHNVDEVFVYVLA